MRVLDQPRERDLSAFSRYLWLHRVRHRIYEEEERQVLEVARPEDAQPVREAFAAWEAGRLEVPEVAVAMPQGAGLDRLNRALQRYPLVLVVVIVSAIVFALTGGGQGGFGLQRWLHFYDVTAPPATVLDGLWQPQLWRYITPAFIHLSVLHIIFNSLIVWELGRRIEPALGSGRFAALFCLTAAVGHSLQFATSPVLFGGLSGVAYGLLGYVMVNARRRPQQARWQLAPGFAIVMLVFLVVWTLGLGEPFGLKVANGAHWGGLVGGVLGGWLIAPRSETPFRG